MDARSSSELVRTRRPAVAGTFYPASPTALRQTLDGFFASLPARPERALPKALVVPHAGYVYSGPIAATAYAMLRTPEAARIRRVVLLGPSHRVPLRGFALPASDAFATPLGSVAIDTDGRDRLAALPFGVVSDTPHMLEHSLEVHLPFLQYTLGTFTLLPVALGDARPREVATLLERVWGGDETLVVISSDLSHYEPYAVARQLDEQTVAHMVALEPDIAHDRACGATGVNGLLEYARHHHVRAELLDLRNSGDTAGSRDAVVGYASLAFYENNHDRS